MPDNNDPAMAPTISQIRAKKRHLLKIGKELKAQFFGIDHVIDRIIASITPWYVLPQAMQRPAVVCCFGLTGVGKTDLVRKLVAKLQMTDKFVEVQLDGTSGGSGYTTDSVCQILEKSSVAEGEPGILLLDEIQRFRTIDVRGIDVKVERFQDVWMLLSDGRFPADLSLYSRLENEIASAAYYAERYADEEREDPEIAVLRAPDDEPVTPLVGGSKAAARLFKEYGIALGDMDEPPPKPKKPKPVTYHISYWEAETYRKLLKLREPIMEIMKWNKQDLIDLCKQALKERKGTQIDYSKLLIFVCGNLDEAFSMADDLEDCDTDADIFHEQTKKVSVISIKEALKERFKPEQISRLGNNYIIYPSLNRDSYQKLIRASCGSYLSYIERTVGLSLAADQSLYDCIYDNSVYPTQGTRPVFSSVSKILGSTLVNVALWCVEHNVRKGRLGMDAHKHALTLRTSDGKVAKTFSVDLDVQTQKDRNSLDFNTMVAVHEAAHAVVYSVLFGFAPLEVKINIASFKGGYTMPDDAIHDKRDALNYMAVLMAGTAGEEFVFGEKHRSSGCSSDIGAATQKAATFVRNLGFDSFSSFIADEGAQFNLNIEPTNLIIDEMLATERERATETLRQHSAYFTELVQQLLHHETLKPATIIALAAKHGLTLVVQKQDVMHSYADSWRRFAALEGMS